MRDDEVHVSSASFWTPEHLPPSAWIEHAPFAFWLCERLKPGLLVDLGGAGASFPFFCQAVEHWGLPTAALAVDPRGDERPGDAASIESGRHSAFAKVVRGGDEAALGPVAGNSVHVLHVDGRPGVDGARRAYESWWPKLADDVVVLLHGTDARQGDAGVRRLFGELAAEHPSFAFAQGRGLGVVCPGRIVPPALRGLLDAGEGSARATRAAYVALGDGLARRARVDAAPAGTPSGEPGAPARTEEQAQTIDLMRRVLAGRGRQIERLRGVERRAEALSRVSEGLRRLLAAKNAAAQRRAALDTGAEAAPAGVSPEGDRRAARAVLDTGLFDEAHYLSAYPDVAADGRPPALHYAVDGWREGRNPSALFDVAHYLAANPDVASAGVDPLVHYAEIGAAEGRAPLPALGPEPSRPDEERRLLTEIEETGLFDEAFYRRHNPDVVGTGVNPALHFARDGWREGRWPRHDFDPRYYLAEYPDVARLGINPLLHFAEAGLLEGRRPSRPGPRCGATDGEYARWVELNDTLSDADRRAIRARILRLKRRPLVTVVMPVYNPRVPFLREAVASVRAQLYPHWELCIADDASPDPAVRDALREMAEADDRIRLVLRPENGHISAASNSALALATGEFVALMDHDDLLPEHALFEVTAALDGDDGYDLVYSDMDHIGRDGRRCRPYFKPDFNIELMLGHNLINHLGVYRRSLIESIGGFRLGYEGSQDYDLALRVIDAVDPRRILHIPRILYHWRSSPAEATFSQTASDRCTAAARAAIGDHLARRGRGGEVVAHPTEPGWHRVVRPRPDPAPLVSVIVAARGTVGALRRCCEGVLGGTDYPNVELVVVDQGSAEPGTRATLSELSRDVRVRVLPHAGAPDRPAVDNAALRRARGAVLAFLDEGVEVLGADWLDEMVALAWLPEVGAVGAKLLDDERRVRHGGVLMGPDGMPRDLSRLLDGQNPGYMGRAVLTAAVSAVAGTCLVIRRSTFERVGGFDEDPLADAFGDVDLCLEVRRAGFRNVFAAQAVLLHHGSPSRGDDGAPEKAARLAREAAFMREKWGDELLADPFYNPNLAVEDAAFALADPPRRRPAWSARG